MPVFAYLQLYRLRLIWSSVLAAVCALAMLYFTSAESLHDYGVLWHHFCGCAPDPTDVYAMLYLPVVTCGGIGAIMGIGLGTGLGSNASGIATPGTAAIRFLFTRPTRRTTVLLAPLVIALAAIIVIPAAALLLLIGWLWLVHAPALGHLVDIVRLMPAAANIGSKPNFLTVIRAASFTKFYFSAISIGVCGYAFYYGQRWWIRSSHTWLRIAAAFGSVLVPMLPALSFLSKRIVLVLLLNLTTFRSLGAQPSNWLIVAHLGVAAACLLSAWQIAQRDEV
jgi:hypothetical protein